MHLIWTKTEIWTRLINYGAKDVEDCSKQKQKEQNLKTTAFKLHLQCFVQVHLDLQFSHVVKVGRTL